jgi:hypothetical protein
MGPSRAAADLLPNLSRSPGESVGALGAAQKLDRFS